MKKKIGILGGMGPEATGYLFDLITRYTAAGKDSDHFPVVIYSNPQIPDRTEAIINNGPSPLPLLIAGAKFLENAGVDFIIMPCITAHYYYPEIVKHIKIPFLHMLGETAIYIEKEMPDVRKFGLLATTGTIETRIFQSELEKRKKETIIPDKKNQSKIMSAVYGGKGIKAGFTNQPNRILLGVVSHLVDEKGCQAVIAGCTEIPLALQPEHITTPLIDPLRIMARRSVEFAGYGEALG